MVFYNCFVFILHVFPVWVLFESYLNFLKKSSFSKSYFPHILITVSLCLFVLTWLYINVNKQLLIVHASLLTNSDIISELQKIHENRTKNCPVSFIQQILVSYHICIFCACVFMLLPELFENKLWIQWKRKNIFLTMVQ